MMTEQTRIRLSIAALILGALIVGHMDHTDAVRVQQDKIKLSEIYR